ncbi:hypothetical protein KGMB02707_06200 [Mesosutterella multiformis]|nr:hypothetical protein KGMB02707_06200 [Mesosutterella multiformis]
MTATTISLIPHCPAGHHAIPSVPALIRKKVPREKFPPWDGQRKSVKADSPYQLLQQNCRVF